MTNNTQSGKDILITWETNEGLRLLPMKYVRPDLQLTENHRRWEGEFMGKIIWIESQLQLYKFSDDFPRALEADAMFAINELLESK